MNRAKRRALARIFGRAKADQPDQRDQRIAELERTVTELSAKYDQVPGVVEDRKDWYVLVGGQRVDLRAISPADWLTSLEELPSFLFAFATERVTRPGGALTSEMLNQIHDLATRWITATAVDLEGVDLSRLTLPEAEHAVVHISELNGVTAHMRKWFRQQLDGVAGPARGGTSVRAETEQPARDSLN